MSDPAFADSMARWRALLSRADEPSWSEHASGIAEELDHAVFTDANFGAVQVPFAETEPGVYIRRLQWTRTDDRSVPALLDRDVLALLGSVMEGSLLLTRRYDGRDVRYDLLVGDASYGLKIRLLVLGVAP